MEDGKCDSGKASPPPRNAKLLNKFQSSKIVLFPSGLEHDNAPQGFHGKGCGFLMVGNGSVSSVRVIKSTVASSSSDMNESIGFERVDEFTSRNAPRQFQALTKTAEDSVDAMRASGGISFPSSASSSTIM